MKRGAVQKYSCLTGWIVLSWLRTCFGSNIQNPFNPGRPLQWRFSFEKNSLWFGYYEKVDCTRTLAVGWSGLFTALTFPARPTPTSALVEPIDYYMTHILQCLKLYATWPRAVVADEVLGATSFYYHEINELNWRQYVRQAWWITVSFYLACMWMNSPVFQKSSIPFFAFQIAFEINGVKVF